jgi:hypothetical protein
MAKSNNNNKNNTGNQSQLKLLVQRLEDWKIPLKMSETPGSTASPQKRPLSEQPLPSSNDEQQQQQQQQEQQQDFKRSKVDTPSIPGIPDNFDIDLTGISNVSTPSLNLELPLTPQLQTTASPLDRSNNNTNNNNNNNNISLQVPESTPYSDAAAITTSNTNNNNDTRDELQKGPTPADPDKLSDALLSAGVDLKAEEALLTQNQLNFQGSFTNVHPVSQQPLVQLDPFLDVRNLTAFVNKIVLANKLKPLNSGIEDDKQILDLITASCEEWMKGILTSTIILSRHRKRSSNKLSKKRSDVSKALRELAVKDKLQEENRFERKKKLGLSSDGGEKEGTEEIQHKATNATVAMMTGGKKKKKYSWMTGGTGAAGGGAGGAGGAGGGGGGGVGGGGGKSGGGGSGNDQTIRYREAREEQGIAVRDLLSSLEKKRMGVEKTLVKGYAKLKD